MCKVYGWGLTKSKGSFEFKVQQVKVPKRMDNGYQWGCTPWIGDKIRTKINYDIVKSLMEKKTICAGSTGFTFCQVCTYVILQYLGCAQLWASSYACSSCCCLVIVVVLLSVI